MAVMHPEDLENYECTATEREMYEAFRDQLPQKYQVFYSIRWFETNHENKRVDSECDFLVFDPSFGFLTIEVKGGIGIDIENGRWFLNEYSDRYTRSRRELKCNPYEQAEKSMRHFCNYFEEEFHQRFNGVYGFAVAFPRYAIDSALAADAPMELTIDVGDMKNLGKRINEIFHYWRNRRNINIPFSPDHKKRFISAINKRIALSAAAGALIRIKEKEFSKIDFMQEAILDVLYHYHQVRVLGGAGTGKTFIAIKKAMRDIKTGKSVLFLCCNKELSLFVKDRLGSETLIDFRTYEELMREIIGEKYDSAGINENGNRSCFDLVSEAHPKLYDSIIVDEGQDFDADMGLTVRLLLRDEKDSSLYVFYDINQNVFEHKADNAFAIDCPPFVLRYNIRNTGCIYKCAVDSTGLGADTIANQLLGVEPDIRQYNSELHGIKELSNIVTRLTQKEFVSTKSIVILSDEPFEKSILATEERVGAYDISFDELREIKDTEICFRTTEEFKGLEADVVIYLKNEYPGTVREEIEKRKEYVALTRARYYLYVLRTKRKVEETY